MASTGSATFSRYGFDRLSHRGKTATAEVAFIVAVTQSRIPSSGERMAVAEPVEATNILGKLRHCFSAMASTGSATGENSQSSVCLHSYSDTEPNTKFRRKNGGG